MDENINFGQIITFTLILKKEFKEKCSEPYSKDFMPISSHSKT